MGLLSNDLAKVRVEEPIASAHTGKIKRRVAPDSPQSIGLDLPISGNDPSTIQELSLIVTLAPKLFTALIVASVSSENNGFEIIDLPFESEEEINILCE